MSKKENREKTYEIPMEVTLKIAREWGYDASQLRWKLVGNRKCLVLMVPATKEQYYAYMRPIWKEQKREMRERRCVISGQKGRLIRCPGENMCAGCPNYLHIDIEDNRSASIELLVEQSSEPASSGAFEEDVVIRSCFDELMAKVTEISPEDGKLLQMLVEELPRSEIEARLEIDSDSLKAKINRIRALGRPIFKNQ